MVAEDQGGTCLCDVGWTSEFVDRLSFDDQVDGFILIYVDDFLIMMSLNGLQDVLDAITSIVGVLYSGDRSMRRPLCSALAWS